MRYVASLERRQAYQSRKLSIVLLWAKMYFSYLEKALLFKKNSFSSITLRLLPVDLKVKTWQWHFKIKPNSVNTPSGGHSCQATHLREQEQASCISGIGEYRSRVVACLLHGRNRFFNLPRYRCKCSLNNT